MAKKIAPPPKKEATAKGDEDLNVLHPDLSDTIAGVKVIVREYGFIEGLKLRSFSQPIVDALFLAVADRSSPPELEEIIGILGEHSDALTVLMAAAADVDEAWVEALGQDDGYSLMYLWWTANGPFFIRRVFQRKAAKRAVENLRAGATSTTPSSPPDTEMEVPPALAE